MIVDQEEFNPLIGDYWHTSLLPQEQMKEIFNRVPEREYIVVGIQWYARTEVARLLLGHHATISIPKCMFPKHLSLDQPWVEDFSSGIYFGPYEVDLRSILFI